MRIYMVLKNTDKIPLDIVYPTSLSFQKSEFEREIILWNLIAAPCLNYEKSHKPVSLIVISKQH